jgi:hypothetical protein
MLPAGTRQLLKVTSPHEPTYQPPSRLTSVMPRPAVPAGISRTEFSPAALTTTARSFATGALAIRSLLPLTTQSPLSAFAVVLMSSRSPASR